jgi:hypothetical protein
MESHKALRQLLPPSSVPKKLVSTVPIKCLFGIGGKVRLPCLRVAVLCSQIHINHEHSPCPPCVPTPDFHQNLKRYQSVGGQQEASAGSRTLRRSCLEIPPRKLVTGGLFLPRQVLEGDGS